MTNKFINSTILNLFIRFLHYKIMLPAFQAGTLACTIAQLGKFIFEVLQENQNLCKLHKQKHGKCNFVRSLDKEKERRP